MVAKECRDEGVRDEGVRDSFKSATAHIITCPYLSKRGVDAGWPR